MSREDCWQSYSRSTAHYEALPAWVLDQNLSIVVNSTLQCSEFLKGLERDFQIHVSGRRPAEAALMSKDSSYPLSRLDSWAKDRDDGLMIWELYRPVWSCPLQQRFGPQGDAGKIICNPSWLRELGDKCIIYSFGIADAAIFEAALMDYAPNCRLRAFDPTTSLKEVSTSKQLEVLTRPNAEFRQVGLGARNEVSSAREFYTGSNHKLKTLRDLMAQFGDQEISLLKLDIEGFEWDVLSAMQKPPQSKHRFPFHQLSIELHLPNPKQRKFVDHSRSTMQSLMHVMEADGLRPFASEVNFWPITHGGSPCCVEYTFVRNDFPVC